MRVESPEQSEAQHGRAPMNVVHDDGAEDPRQYAPVDAAGAAGVGAAWPRPGFIER
jgi:hypothetical protein